MSFFSRRTAWETHESAFAVSIRDATASNRIVADLTVSNPTLCEFVYDTEATLAALHCTGSLVYEADPLGIPQARQAVSQYYADHGATISPASILLSTSTSEGYGYLFRLLCDPGDEVLVPQPGYPLFGYLADLHDVHLRTYPIFSDFGWWIDFAELERGIGQRTKAILVVHPANPTGHWTGREERRRLEELCAKRGLVLIVDEVFLDYSLNGQRPETFVAGQSSCLTFVLSGLSKIAGLPQMKVAWLVVRGPAELVSAALARLEVIADTFLSMGAPAQYALSPWLAQRHSIQTQILQRTRDNIRIVGDSGLQYLPVDAGWSVILRLPGVCGDAEQVLHQRGVLVHPGHFYGLAGKTAVVASLITPADVFAAGIDALTAHPVT